MNKGLLARKKILRSKVVEHHILYQYDGLRHKQAPISVHIYNNEHYILSLLQKRGKWVSWGFLQSLKQFVWERETTRHFDDLELWNIAPLPPKPDDTIQKTEEPVVNAQGQL
jgi:hypothetical protein